MDDRRPGCKIIIHMHTRGFDIDLRFAVQWINNKSGLSKDVVQKILIVNLVNHEYGKNIIIQFDTTGNCFEALQQIVRKNPNKSASTYYEVMNMACPRGRFCKINVHCAANPIYADLRVTRYELEKHGIIVRLQRTMLYGICTGNVEALMLLKKDSKLLDNEWKKSKASLLKVEPFIPTVYSRIEPTTIHHLWVWCGQFVQRYDDDDFDDVKIKQEVEIIEID